MYSEGNLAMKKVLIIAYYFPPLGWSGVQRTLKFVKYLRKFGWEPVVVTVGETKFSILDETLVNEIPKGVQVIKIDDVKFKHVTDNAKQILKSYTECISNTILDSDLKQKYEEAIEQKISELRDLLLIPDGNAIWANNVIKSINIKIDLKDINVIYTTSAPYSSHLIGQHIKEKYNIPWVADFRDEWINNADYIIDEETLDFEIQKYMENTVVEKCDKIITTTPHASQNFVDRYNLNDKKVYTITNGYDEEDFYKIKENKKNNKFTIIHNGSCYLNRSPQTFFKAVRNLIERGFLDKSKIEIIFVGKNDAKVMEESKIEIEEYNILREVGYCSHNKSLELLTNSHLLLLILGSLQKQKSVYPGKVFEYLKIEKPILAISPQGSVVENLLKETECGVNIEYNEIEKIEKIILNYYNKWISGEDIRTNGKNINQYERKNLTKRLCKIFNEMDEYNKR